MEPTITNQTNANDTLKRLAVNNHWTGLVEWTTGMDYWTDLSKNHIMPSNELVIL